MDKPPMDAWFRSKQHKLISSEPEWLLVLKIHKDGSFSEEYNGPGKLAWEHCGKMQKNGQRPISLAKLRQLQTRVPQSERLKQIM